MLIFIKKKKFWVFSQNLLDVSTFFIAANLNNVYDSDIWSSEN